MVRPGAAQAVPCAGEPDDPQYLADEVGLAELARPHVDRHRQVRHQLAAH